jgi:hypothetical protein
MIIDQPHQPASQRLSQLPDLRDAVGSWHEAFAADGPYSEDVTSWGEGVEVEVSLQ